MSTFEIDLTRTRNASKNILSLRSDLRNSRSSVNSVLRNLNFHDFHYADSALKTTENNLLTLSNRMRKLSASLDEIVKMYENTESDIVGKSNAVTSDGSSFKAKNVELADVVDKDILDAWEKLLELNKKRRSKAYSIDSVVFDSEGGYGGNQGHMEEVYYWDPIHCWELLYQLRTYYPHMSILNAFTYFSTLNNVGCGYVALANTLFVEFEGRESEFERTFGFPMYKDGDLNFDRLILDIYATIDKSDKYDTDGKLGGIHESTVGNMVNDYLSQKGITSTYEVKNTMTPEEFEAISKNGGKVVIGLRYDNIYKKNGGDHYIDGGHAMMITGVTDDGKYVVSSWGDKYYVDPKDLDSNDSFMIFNYDT